MSDSLTAVVFDVDGTLVDSERFGHRVAFNEAFAALGLPYHWDETTYGELLLVPSSERRLNHFLTGEGLTDDLRAQLVRTICEEKTGRLLAMIENGEIPPRRGVTELLRELSGAGIRLGVATAGTRSWVVRLLEQVFPDVGFDAVVTTSDVLAAKPDPECYRVALERLKAPAPAVLAVEDSSPGLVAATAAGLRTIVVSNDYTAEHDTAGAALVLDGFGPEARVRTDPHRLRARPPIDLAVMRAVLAGTPTPTVATPDRGAMCTT